MRRLVSLVVLLLFTVPFGLSVTGCSKSTPVVYCNGGDSGPVVGQVATISLAPIVAATGESINYGQSGPALNATAADCKNNPVSVKSYTYATSDNSLTYADINPQFGQVCAGSWNRNSGGGIANYTTCTAPSSTAIAAAPTHLFYVTATADGATSNAIPVYTHATVGSVQIVANSAVANGTCGTATAGTPTTTSDCCVSSLPVTPPAPPIYNGSSCNSQNVKTRLIGSVFDTSGNNITCQVGNLIFSPQGTSNVVTINTNGEAIPGQPGSTTITASISGTGSNTAGYFSTCPPASILLTAQGQTAAQGPINVPLNQAQSFTASVFDTLGNPITGLGLTYVSTSPQTLPGGAATVTPIFPGTASISAVCAPGASCNPAPFNQIGLNGNGEPVTSNSITVNTVANSSTVLFVASTQSQYLFPQDFTTNQPPGLVKLPFIPNSMVISQSGTTIYLGSPLGLMIYSTASNTVNGNTNVVGYVLAVSPDSNTVAVADPTRQTISLVTGSGSVVSSTYNAVVPATPSGAPFPLQAEWSPDSQTLYITGTLNPSQQPQLLVHSVFNGWLPITSDQSYTDVAVMVPAVGAYFAGPQSTEGRSYCSNSTNTGGTPPVTVNTYYPVANVSTAISNLVAATADGNHILGATPTTLSDIAVTLQKGAVQPGATVASIAPCPTSPVSPGSGLINSSFTSYPLSGITASTITGVVPTRNSAVSVVTYTGSSGILPMYVVPTSGTGTVTPITLSGTATAPVAGVFDTFDGHFYAGTSGDNLVHTITMTYPASGAPTAIDSGTLTPNIPCEASGTYGTPVPACGGATIATPNLIVQMPKKATS